MAFLGDFNVTLLWRVSQNWTSRAGYMFLWADQVALASDNFNAGPPFVAGQRTTFIDNGSDVFYHGVDRWLRIHVVSAAATTLHHRITTGVEHLARCDARSAFWSRGDRIDRRPSTSASTPIAR